MGGTPRVLQTIAETRLQSLVPAFVAFVIFVVVS